jgi:hypothetical protein
MDGNVGVCTPSVKHMRPILDSQFEDKDKMWAGDAEVMLQVHEE